MAESIENVEPPRAEAAPSVRASLPLLVLASVAALAAAVAFRALADLETGSAELEGAEAFAFDPAGSSPPLIFAGTAWLLARRWGRLSRALGAPSRPFAALAGFGAAAALCLWGYYTGEHTLLIPALSLAMGASALWVGGTPALRAVLLPACFLLLAFPIPPILINRILYPVQLATAEAAGAVLRLAGLDVMVHADRIFYGGTVFQVIESCSGVRSVETMLMSALLYHDLFYRSRLQSTILVLASPLIALFTNLLRVLTIVLNPYSRFAAVHETQGLVMIVVAVFLLAGVDAVLTRLLPAGRRPRRLRAQGPLAPLRLGVWAAALAALAVASVALPPWPAPTRIERPLSGFPPRLTGHQSTALAIDRQFLGSVGFSEWVHRRYEREDLAQPIDLLLGSDHRLDQRTNFLSEKTALPASGWRIVERDETRLGPDGPRVDRFTARLGQEQQRVYRFTAGVAGFGSEAARAILALDRGPTRRPDRAVLVRISTPIGPTETVESADARVEAFAAEAAPEFAKLLAPGAGPLAAH